MMNQNKRLNQLVDLLCQEKLLIGENGCKTIEVKKITADSREAEEGTLFVCKGLWGGSPCAYTGQ